MSYALFPFCAFLVRVIVVICDICGILGRSGLCDNVFASSALYGCSCIARQLTVVYDRDFFKVKLGSDGSVRAKEQANKIYLWRQDYYFCKLLSKLEVDASRIDVV